MISLKSSLEDTTLSHWLIKTPHSLKLDKKNQIYSLSNLPISLTRSHSLPPSLPKPLSPSLFSLSPTLPPHHRPDLPPPVDLSLRLHCYHSSAT
ncbi:hypothetical protein Sjap_012681 [Stephania japonica]|uniref:Uncharacterized protein n=1 Tax=Stephania japonica TaxID=461633 RepID=A0AAP0IWI7_9MAGN